jgi:hypothetical protein
MESRWRLDYLHPSISVQPSLLYNEYRITFWVKRPRLGFHHPTNLTPKLKKE